jgi:two-component system, response regulator YesN
MEEGNIMLSLLIVEDEDQQRKALVNLIDWNELGIDSVLEARNGECALDILKAHSCDIILTDITMPVMDGLTLARTAKKMDPCTEIIIISCHGDYDFTSKAIEIATFRYILKPIDIDQLKDIVRDCVGLIENRIRKSNISFQLNQQYETSHLLLKQKVTKDLLHDTSEGEEEVLTNLKTLNIGFHFEHYAVITILIDNVDVDNGDIDPIALNNMKKNIESLIDETIGRFINGFLSCQIDDIHSVILGSDDGSDAISAFLQHISGNVEDAVSKRYHVNASIGIGSIVERLALVHRSFLESRSTLEARFVTGKSSSFAFMDHQADDMLDSMKTLDREDLSRKIDDLFLRLIQIRNVGKEYFKCLCLVLLERICTHMLDPNETPDRIFQKMNIIQELRRFENTSDIQRWTKDTLLSIKDYYSNNRNKTNLHFVRDVSRYMEKNYSNDISVKSISDYVFMSPNYFSAIFKQKYGINFCRYLLHFRLDKAKELLKDASLSISDISLQVGIPNISYMSAKFKSKYGVSPSEYRHAISSYQVDADGDKMS